MIDGIERVGVYGGTFAPVHNGHVAAARAFYEQMKLDRVLIIPDRIPPHKSIDRGDDPEKRLEMCRLAFDFEGACVSDIELRREGVSYTVDTLRELSEPCRKLFLLCGTDMMLTFDEWHEFREIFRLCCPVYIRRENDTSLNEKIIAKNSEYFRKYNVAFRRIISDPIVMNSSEIRAAVHEGRSIHGMVPDAVEKYIKENGLYV